MIKTELTNLEQGVMGIIEEHGQDYEDGPKGFVKDVMYGGCITGIVPELIYYEDTHAWFDKYFYDIIALRDEGAIDDPPKGEDIKNWFAWRSFEETAYRLFPDCE